MATSRTPHEALAVEFLAEASDCQQQIEDLGEHHANTWEARSLSRHGHYAMKMAEVHALLAVATGIAWPSPPETDGA